MPSVLVGNQSGGQPIVSGNYFSGRAGPIGGIQLRWSPSASGNAYVGYSGGITVASGGLFQSGTDWIGQLDAMPLKPGDALFVPKLMLNSGQGFTNVYVLCDAAASGQGRLYWESQ